MWAFSAPDYWGAPEVSGESFLEDELCCIDAPDLEELHFFIRGLIEIPVRGSAELLTYNVWVSLSPANFERAVQLWDDPARTEDVPAQVGGGRGGRIGCSHRTSPSDGDA